MASSKRKPSAAKNPTLRKLSLKQSLFLKYYTDTKQKDSHGVHTFGNRTRSYALAYGRQPDQTSAVQGGVTVRRPYVQNELERLAAELGIGTKVRMGTLHDIAKGSTIRTVRSRQYAYVDDGPGKRKKVLTSVTETDNPTRDSDRVRAVQVINKMTGLDALQSATAAIAIRESKDIYDRMVRPTRKERSVPLPRPVSQSPHDTPIPTPPTQSEPVSADTKQFILDAADHARDMEA